MNSVIGHLENLLPNVAEDYKTRRTQLFIFLVLLQIGFTGLTFFICIFFSHKIAGPLYKLQKHLGKIRNKETHSKLTFRKGDYFQDLAEEVNMTFDQIEEDYKNDLMYMSEVSSYLNNLSLVVPDDKRVVLNEIINRLDEIQGRFNQRG